MTLNDVVNKELELREEIKEKIMGIILSSYEIGNGWIHAGDIQQLAFNELGFHGKKSYSFCRYINKMMIEKGFRLAIRRGYKTFYGVIKKQPCQIQSVSASLSKTTQPLETPLPL